MIQGDQGEDTQGNPHPSGRGCALCTCLPQSPGHRLCQSPAPLINHLASWSFSSLVSSVRHQKPFRKLNPKPPLTGGSGSTFWEGRGECHDVISRELGEYAVQRASTPHLSTYLAGCWGFGDEEVLVPLSIAAS